MKKFKFIILFSLIFCLLLSLTGCVTLDELRSTHAVYQDEQETQILLNGAEYRLLTANNGLLRPDTENNISIRATHSNVPLLLHRQLGHFMSISNDKRFLVDGGAIETTAIYCRTDCYEEVTERLQQPFVPDGVCYEYYDEQEGQLRYQRLTADQQQAVQTVLQTVAPMEVQEVFSITHTQPATPIDLITYDHYSYYDLGLLARLEECSDDLLLRRQWIEVLIYNDIFFLSTDPQTVYLIPTELTDTFRQMFSPLL